MIGVLAHQGGWDEVLLFLVPAALGVWALRWANERAKRRQAEGEAEAARRSAADPGGPDDGDDPTG